MITKSKAMCDGCRENYYNGVGECPISGKANTKECWHYESARVVRRFRIGWWTPPGSRGAFTEVETLHCHHAPGKYAHYDELPAFAFNPKRLQP